MNELKTRAERRKELRAERQAKVADYLTAQFVDGEIPADVQVWIEAHAAQIMKLVTS